MYIFMLLCSVNERVSHSKYILYQLERKKKKAGNVWYEHSPGHAGRESQEVFVCKYLSIPD